MPNAFSIGKVPPQTLIRTVYSHTGRSNPRLLIGPGIGKDVAAVKYDRLLMFTADPITATSSRIGEHSVYINANDVAAAGASPTWYICTILLPSGASERDLAIIMRGIDRACRRLGVTVVRGHTEAIRGLDRPIVAGFMIGERKGRLLRAEDVRVGDLIVMTRTAGIEGTAILASDHARLLKRVPDGALRRARGFSSRICVVREALALARIPGLRVMHDPTEGGVLNACWELGEASDLGVAVWADRIPVAEETSLICSELNLDPLRLMSSGCLLAVVPPKAIGRTAREMGRIRVRTSIIGRMTRKSEGRRYSSNGRRLHLRAVPRDELYTLG